MNYPNFPVKLCLAAAALGLAFTVNAQQVPVVEKQLSNGMKLLMVERHDDPSVSGAWLAHVGSANERPGITGIAHLFEHMMFKGTPVIGTTSPPSPPDSSSTWGAPTNARASRASPISSST